MNTLQMAETLSYFTTTVAVVLFVLSFYEKFIPKNKLLLALMGLLAVTSFYWQNIDRGTLASMLTNITYLIFTGALYCLNRAKYLAEQKRKHDIKRIIESVPHPACILNKDGTIEFKNHAYEEIASDKCCVGDEPKLIEKDHRSYLIAKSRSKEVDLGDSLLFVFDVTSPDSLKSMLGIKKQKIQRLIDNVSDLIWVKDPEGKYTQINQSYAELYGEAYQDILGNTYKELFGPEIAKVAHKALSGESLIRYCTEFISSNGDRHYVEVYEYPILDENGNLFEVLGIGRPTLKM